MLSVLSNFAVGCVLVGFTVQGILLIHGGHIGKGVASLLLAIANLLLIR